MQMLISMLKSSKCTEFSVIQSPFIQISWSWTHSMPLLCLHPNPNCQNFSWSHYFSVLLSLSRYGQISRISQLFSRSLSLPVDFGLIRWWIVTCTFTPNFILFCWRVPSQVLHFSGPLTIWLFLEQLDFTLLGFSQFSCSWSILTSLFWVSHNSVVPGAT